MIMEKGIGQGIKEGNTIAIIVKKKAMICIIVPTLEMLVVLLLGISKSPLLEKGHWWHKWTLGLPKLSKS